LDNIIGLILAGGQGRRLGGVDKAFVSLGGETMIARTVARARPQVGELLINANGDPARFAALSVPVLPDCIGGFLGPLAGILTGLTWMRENRPKARWLASFSCDSPFFPPDLVEKLVAKAESEKSLVAFATSAEHVHPVFAVWSTDIDDAPEDVLLGDLLRKVEDFIALFPYSFVNFPYRPVDPFFNINTPEELARAESLLAANKKA
jgi:molybdopterin-guanine dinucleotide biosynthesis protein A